MKKEYINPEMEVIKIETQMMLAVSDFSEESADEWGAPGLDEPNMFGF